MVMRSAQKPKASVTSTHEILTVALFEKNLTMARNEEITGRPSSKIRSTQMIRWLMRQIASHDVLKILELGLQLNANNF